MTEVAVALVRRHLVPQGAQRKSALLIAVGVSGFVFPIVRLLVDLTLGAFLDGSSAHDAISAILMTEVVGAVVLGGPAGYFGRRRLLDGFVIAAYYLPPWILQSELCTGGPPGHPRSNR